MVKIEKGKCYVNGEFIATKDYRPVKNPFNGETIGECPVSDDGLLESAMAGSVDSFKPFKSMARHERSPLLHNVSRGIAAREDEFARLICMEGGKPIKLAEAEVNRSQLVSRYAAEEATRFGGDWLALDIHPGMGNYTGLLGRVPLGPALAISPFNFPLNLIMHKLAPAIAVGCPTIIKPSSETPFTALKLAEVCHEAGLPPGSVNIVPCPGPSFEKLVTDDRAKMLSFTGSAEVGWKLKEIAGKKRVALELGGNAGVIVHEDAEIEYAAKKIVFGGFAHAGQICISVQRVFIHEPIYDTFVKMLIDLSKQVKSGDPADEEVIVGPMITAREADRVEAWIEEAIEGGAKALLRGNREGQVICPTILSDVRRDAKVYAGELFGPVIIVMPYKNWDGEGGALELLNDSVYGLQAGIFTKDVNRIMQAYQELEVGGVIANEIPTFRVDNYPYGGTKESGQGREGISCTMHEMTEERVLVIRI